MNKCRGRGKGDRSRVRGDQQEMVMGLGVMCLVRSVRGGRWMEDTGWLSTGTVTY